MGPYGVNSLLSGVLPGYSAHAHATSTVFPRLIALAMGTIIFMPKI